MPEESFQLREGSADDLPALTRLKSDFSNQWLLSLERGGGPVEQTIELRWRKARPEGSRRDLRVDLEELAAGFERSERLIVAEQGGRIAGYVMVGKSWNRTAELALIIVDAAYRGRGLGRRFVEEADAYARERGLRALQWETQTDNRNAIEFALAQGFRIAGFHDALYENRGDERQDAPDFRGLAVYLTRELD